MSYQISKAVSKLSNANLVSYLRADAGLLDESLGSKVKMEAAARIAELSERVEELERGMKAFANPNFYDIDATDSARVMKKAKSYLDSKEQP